MAPNLFKKLTYLITLTALSFTTSFSQKVSIEKLVNKVFAQPDYEAQLAMNLHLTDSLFYTNNAKFHYYFLDSLVNRAHRSQNIKLEASALMSKGSFYSSKGNNFNSIETVRKAIVLYEKIKGYNGLNSAYTNLGNTYFYMGEFEKALEYYKLAVESIKNITKSTINTESSIASLYNNMGSVYCSKNDFKYGRVYFEMAHAIWGKQHDSISIAYVYNNYAQIFMGDNKMDSALYYYEFALKIKNKLGTLDDKIDARNNLGAFYIRDDKPLISLKYLKEALKLLDTLIYSRQLVACYENLYTAYNMLADTKNEYKYFKLHAAAGDSASNNEQLSNITKLELQFEFGKIHLSDSIKSVEEIKLKDVKLESGKKQSYFLILILILTIIALSIIYSRFKLTKKQKQIIEEQKHIVDVKNKEILDSIIYAKRLQEAILPPLSLLKKYLPESFVFYKPKDIVAGDFYWMFVSENSTHQFTNSSSHQILIAAADCTGHGVPGAMVSVVCSNALDRAVKEFGLIEPGKILDKVRELVIETFEKSENDVKDGMDISLLLIDPAKKIVQWSGANNRLLYIQNNELKEIKANRESVGKSDYQKPFITHAMTYEKGMTFYLFTDGYIDQFGGEKMKKININNFKELIKKHQNSSLNEQNAVINDYFLQWKGAHEQIDDITILGIKI